MANWPSDAIATQLLTFLPDVKTSADVHAWLAELTPALCSARPDLLLKLSPRLSLLLGSFTSQEVSECVKLCLSTAWPAHQSFQVWSDLCSGLHKLPLAGMEALLACLHDQNAQGQLPENGSALIDHVTSVVAGMSKTLPRLGFGAPSDMEPAVPIEATQAALHEDASPMKLTHDVVTLAMAHALREQDIDLMRPEFFGPRNKDRQVLLDLALVDKKFFTRFAPMLANYPWMQWESLIRSGIVRANEHELADPMDHLIRYLVDLEVQTVKSMLPCAPGVAQRRLDVVLQNFVIDLDRITSAEAGEALMPAYLKLHDRAVLQLASQKQAMSPCYAQHMDLSALPLQFLTMAYRMRSLEAPGIAELAVGVAYSLPAYPADIQAQTLISLLSILPDPSAKTQILARLNDLMGESNSWSTPGHAWLRCQWSNLNGMLALLEAPSTVLEQAAQAADSLLVALKWHHGVSDEPALLIDDPFGERRVLWTIADIRLLAALCKRSEAFAEWKAPGLVDCLADLSRQFCSVSAGLYKFAAPGFKEEFPSGMLDSASLRLTPGERQRMLGTPDATKARHHWHMPS
jgi:hypothetical protein